MPLFSKKHDGDDGDAAGSNGRPGEAQAPSSSPVLAPAQPAPDEHTRLLPSRIDSAAPRGMLDPDDPAVSPYNLWSVRILRYLTLALAALNFAWWVVLLASAFATPPGLHTRGSSFFAFGYASLALANLAFTLVFFGVPSKAVRMLSVVMSVRPCALSRWQSCSRLG